MRSLPSMLARLVRASVRVIRQRALLVLESERGDVRWPVTLGLSELNLADEAIRLLHHVPHCQAESGVRHHMTSAKGRRLISARAPLRSKALGRERHGQHAIV
jgi:hypothetical protein